tara:strand:+ start:161 stop:346 length:186 start_codon:yes stop_codon:yes gene_type:complete
MKIIRLLILTVSLGLLAGCSTPPLEDRGQTRFEQQEAGFKDSSDREREQANRTQGAQKFGD